MSSLIFEYVGRILLLVGAVGLSGAAIQYVIADVQEYRHFREHCMSGRMQPIPYGAFALKIAAACICVGISAFICLWVIGFFA